MINELFDDAATNSRKPSRRMRNRCPRNRQGGLGEFQGRVFDDRPAPATDFDFGIGITADNRVVTTNQPIAMQAMDVTVELDGVADRFRAGNVSESSGFAQIRLSREGFDTWERTINIYDGQSLRVALQMSNAGYERWADTTGFLSKLDNTRKLTDAEVKQMEGVAEYFKNSHYRVDTKENIHPTYKSLF